MRYLITGGAGFIGSHLAERLLSHGHDVTILDDLSTGRLENVRHLEANPRFSKVIDTVANAERTSALVHEADFVFHLAAAVGVRLIVESPVRTIETNVRGTEVVLSAASRRGTKVLVASTSEVYGKSEHLPFREDGDLVLGPTTKCRWSYACSKAIDEFLALAYHHEREVPAIVVRFFNTVGPRQTGTYGMVVPTFVRQALEGQPITVYGSGEQRRCFTHVSDAVDALVALAGSSEAHGQVFNVGNTEEISIGELARTVREATDSKSDIVHVPYDQAYRPGFEDMHRRVPAIDKINAFVGWKPRRGLGDILRDVIVDQRGAA